MAAIFHRAPPRRAPSPLTLTLMILAMLSGCATVPEPAPDAPSGTLFQHVDSGAHPLFRSVVETAAAENWAPIPTSLEPESEASAAFHLKLNFRVREKPLHDTEAIWTMTTLLLATVYPSTCARYELELTADLHDSSKNRIKSWNLIEQDTAFLWLFQGSECMGQTDETIRKIAEAMLKDLYGRIDRDDVLTAKAVTPVDARPLVYVSAENADSLIERVIKTEAPFDNFTFVPAADKTVHRTLKIRFEFIQADPGVAAIIGRGSMAIMTLGLVSVCAPNEMILNAEVLDGTGTLLREYRFGRNIRGSMLNDCARPTDRTHPRQATDLLRQLFDQIKEDNVI